MSAVRLLCLALLCSLLVGCAGREFARPSASEFKLGTTTEAEVVQKYGEPQKLDYLTRDGATMKRVTYMHSAAIPYSTNFKVRALVVVYESGKVIGYDYASSFADDATMLKLDGSLVEQISKGDQRARVVRLLGPPTGEQIFPAIPMRGHTLLRYSYADSHRIPFTAVGKISQKTTAILFDPSDAVVTITTTEQSNH